MPDVLIRAASEVIVVDGAMGTMLSRMGLPPGEPPELLNVTAPETVADVHAGFIEAGAMAVSTNTFGGSRPKLAKWGIADQVVELNRVAVRIAREAGAQHVLADVGPTGLTMEPVGSVTFDDVFAAFAEQIAALASESPDAIFLETFTDLAEARAALLAARDVCDLPVLVSLSYGLAGRTELSGTDPETAAAVFEALGAAAIGMNCGLGPEQMLPLLRRMCAATSLPVIAQPNAGMPRLEDGATVFPGTPDEVAAFAVDAAAAGAAFVGSCCGSTPAFTGEIALAVEGARPVAHGPSPDGSRGVRVASPRSVVTIGGGTRLKAIGERINPTGKKALAESLREGSMWVVRDYAVAQEHAGADLLDVNVGAAGVDAASTLPRAVLALSALTALPLVIDTTDPAALEAALRAYPGRALVNTVNGGADSMAAVLPLAKRYGAAVVVLALDDDGIAETAEGRLAVVDRVRAAAHSAGLSDADLVVDGLVHDRGRRAGCRRSGARHRQGGLARAWPGDGAGREQREPRPARPAAAERRVPVDGRRGRAGRSDREPRRCGGRARDRRFGRPARARHARRAVGGQDQGRSDRGTVGAASGAVFRGAGGERRSVRSRSVRSRSVRGVHRVRTADACDRCGRRRLGSHPRG